MLKHLTDAIQQQARVSSAAAHALAALAIQGGYSGGDVVIGIGDYGFDTTLYGVIWQAGGRWQMVAGCFMADRFCRVDSGAAQDVQSVRWSFAFNHNGRLVEVSL